MTDILLPLSLRQATNSFRYIDNTGITRGVYTGYAQTTSYGGDRVGASIEFTKHGGSSSAARAERARLMSFLMNLRGKQNRVYYFDQSYTPRGTWVANAGGELFTNTEFNGTTGWLVGAKYNQTAADGVLRALVVDGSQTNSYPAYQGSLAVTNYAPYVMRGIISIGRGSFSQIMPLCQNAILTNFDSTGGYKIHSTGGETSGTFGFFDNATSGHTAGDYLEILFASASRCMFADGGGNLITSSDAFGSWGLSGVTVTSDAVAAADGTTTGDAMVENAATSEHYVTNTVTVPATSGIDYTFSVDVNAANRAWVNLRIIEATGPTEAQCFFNASTGTIGNMAVGANWSNVRAHIVSRGNSWYRCTVTARKTNAATSLFARVNAATANGASNSFTGNSLTACRLWRGVLQASSQPTRGAGTSGSASAAATLSGGSINVKGLPISQNGLLVIGDWVEIDGQIKMLTSSLNSDASGIGYLQFAPPLRRAISDNTPIIVHRPMGRFVLAGDAGFMNEPGVFTGATLDLEEA